ncbi:MAG: DUF1987 domain-containing protein [Bacteroidales bacterium]|nr:DUF1987 domain-containing protein [Bacteroidales bacterium]
MNDLIIEATEFTPEIYFSLTQRKFHFKGVSRPEDVIKFYNPAIQWLKELEQTIHSHVDMRYTIPLLHIEFRLNYFNSASSKMLLQILQILKRIKEMGIDLVIDWYYDANDEAMYEDGMDLSESVDIPFNFHSC